MLFRSLLVGVHGDGVVHRLLGDLHELVGPQRGLVGGHGAGHEIGHVQDDLGGPVVDAQIVGVEELGQVVQDAGVRVPEFVERLGTIRFDAYLEKNSTNFSCFVFK